jgi:threonine dehydrogenase-like Zn-dependent dehydrogenase
LDARRITLQEIIFQGSYCYSEKDFAESLSLIADGVVTGEGWAEMRPLAEGAKSFVDIHEGIAPPKIILDTDL